MLPSLPYYKSNYIHYFLLHDVFEYLNFFPTRQSKKKTKIEIKFILFYTKLTEQCEISRTFTLALSR